MSEPSRPQPGTVPSPHPQILAARRLHVLDRPARPSARGTDATAITRLDAKRLIGSFTTTAASGVIVALGEPRALMTLDEHGRGRLVDLIAAVVQSDESRIAAVLRHWTAPSRVLVDTVARSALADRADWRISGVAWTLQGIHLQATRDGHAMPDVECFTTGLLARLDLLHEAHPALLDGFTPSDLLGWLKPIPRWEDEARLRDASRY